MKALNYLVVVSVVALLFPLSALARAKNEHSLNIVYPVKVGSTQLKPGDYKVKWQGAGPAVQVRFLRNGDTVASAAATLRTNDNQVTQDDIITNVTSAKAGALREIDFGRQKEALVFARSGV